MTDEKDSKFLKTINSNPTLLKLVGQTNGVSEAANVEGLLRTIIGNLKSVGYGDEQALTYINAELKVSGGGAKAADISEDMANEINLRKSDSESDPASTADSSIDYKVDHNGELMVTMNPKVAPEQHPDENSPSSSFSP